MIKQGTGESAEVGVWFDGAVVFVAKKVFNFLVFFGKLR